LVSLVLRDQPSAFSPQLSALSFQPSAFSIPLSAVRDGWR
jgi:hypothetical protein